MRRACYCKKETGFQVLRLKAVRKDGYVETEPIKDLSEKVYQSLEEALIEVNKNGYGVIGDLEEIKASNNHKIYVQKCGNNMMDIDDL